VTRIDFHFNVDNRLHYACRVIRKARAAGKRVVVYAPQPERLVQFDSALWTFSALDFVPHVDVDSPLAANTPVLLASRRDSIPASDLLVPLDDDVAAAFEELFARFERVIEVVACDDGDRTQARARFKRYRERGFEPTAFDAKNGE